MEDLTEYRGDHVDQARWQQIEALFRAASELPEDQRSTYLAGATGDPELRAEVEGLLAADRKPDGFLRQPIARELEHRAKALRPPGSRLGRYRLLRALGSGGMGTVYLAKSEEGSDGTVVAVKLLRTDFPFPDAERRFRAEQRILASLRHPNIAELLDAGATDAGVPFVVMEYVPGETIDRFCDSQWLTLEQRIELMLPVCDAVHYANRQRIVHRDLKPGNVMVTRDGVPKLLDFGIAKLLDAQGIGARTTRTGMAMLTPSYASPEQLSGGAITPATDVYSLGVVLYELATGQLPYLLSATGALDRAREIMRAPPVRPAQHRPALAGDLEAVLLKALVKEPAGRYPSAEALGQDLCRWLRGEPVRAKT
jgi:serine/threonine protein kinase